MRVAALDAHPRRIEHTIAALAVAAVVLIALGRLLRP